MHSPVDAVFHSPDLSKKAGATTLFRVAGAFFQEVFFPAAVFSIEHDKKARLQGLINDIILGTLSCKTG
jgi:hypothetical protein